MKILQLDQGSDKWLALRQAKITGTDSGILTGSNPYKTKLELWEQKLGLREPDKPNEKMKRGSLLEEPARLLLNKTLGIDFKPMVVVSDKYPCFMASLDGLSPCERFICEIKCPSNIAIHEGVMRDQVCAEYYYDQMQHCLAVTECEMCYFCSYFPGHTCEIIIMEIKPDLEKQAEIIAKGQEFYINMCTMNPPNEWKLNLR